MCVFTTVDFYRNCAYVHVAFLLYCALESNSCGWQDTVSGDAQCPTAQKILIALTLPNLLLAYMCYHTSTSMGAVQNISFADLVSSSVTEKIKMNAAAGVVKQYPRTIKMGFCTIAGISSVFGYLAMNYCTKAGTCYSPAAAGACDEPEFLLVLSTCSTIGSGSTGYAAVFFVLSFNIFFFISGSRSQGVSHIPPHLYTPPNVFVGKAANSVLEMIDSIAP
ncbi:unnamed protein product [Amoebophrya sp. A25]|nr:unnamed protein product [Amoebophrya sp. A25]|eukprot:GSA25T00025772001.1